MKFLFLPAAGWDKSTNHVLCEECFANTLFEVHGRFNRGCTRQDFASCCVDWILLTLHQFRDFFNRYRSKSAVFFFSGEAPIRTGNGTCSNFKEYRTLTSLVSASTSFATSPNPRLSGVPDRTHRLANFIPSVPSCLYPFRLSQVT